MKTLEQMAVEAGIACLYKGELHPSIREGCDTREELRHFAALVAERCAEVAEKSGGLDATMAAQAILAEFPKP